MATPDTVPGTLPKPWKAQTETGAPTARSDCGVLTTTYQVQVSSGNRITPAKVGMTWPAWVRELRAAMGRPSGATSTADWYRAWRSAWMRALFDRAGYQVPKVQRLHGSSWDTMKAHLRAGRSIGLCVDYGVLRRMSGQLDVPVGSDTFSDGHALGLVGLRVSSGLVFTNDLDPLFDGTPAKVPDAPAVARLAAFKAAAGAFGRHPHGFGKVEAVSVGVALRKPAQPAPELDIVAELDSLEDDIERAHNRLLDLRQRVAAAGKGNA